MRQRLQRLVLNDEETEPGVIEPLQGSSHSGSGNPFLGPLAQVLLQGTLVFSRQVYLASMPFEVRKLSRRFSTSKPPDRQINTTIQPIIFHGDVQTRIEAGRRLSHMTNIHRKRFEALSKSARRYGLF